MRTLPSINKRYQLLGPLGQGGMGEVYSAYDRLTGSTIALKRVVGTAKEGPQVTTQRVGATDFRVALANEFRMLASLRHPNIISVLDYGFDTEQQPFFTMDLLETPQTILEAGQDQPIAVRINLIVQLLQALAYLHRRGVVHLDLKPDNVLVVAGQVKVLDFGLSVPLKQLAPDEAFLSGTIGYIAPEMFLEWQPSERADLYAVGVIAYQLITGRHPFEGDAMIQRALTEAPDLAPLGDDPRITTIIGRLLARDPRDRFASAAEVIRLYAQTTGQAIRYESAAIRDSFIQAADFVGREAELARLTTALEQMQAGAGGSAWLIGGESGVGKSRLLDELRTQALVEGALTTRGQALAEAALPYQLWREAARYLCLQTDLSDLQAGVLKALVPDIGVLLGRDVPDAPEIELQAAQNRLLNVVEELFRQQSEPLVLLLEDLHWSSESLTILKRLLRALPELSLLIVATYRDDERPDLPDDLPGMRVMHLNRLAPDAISALSASMLGEAGRQPQVIDLLSRETEGNVFFIVEVVRALAEEAGQLDRVGAMTLPQSVFAGGMQRILQRRLGRVPPKTVPALQQAAVVGRQIDLNLMRHFSPGEDQDEWLAACANAAVLDVYDGRWRFSHDKLREAALRELDEGQLRTLHREAALAIEKVYSADLSPYLAGLAEHWRAAAEPEKALDYLIRAGEQALDIYAYRDAVQILDDALALAETTAGVSVEQRALWRLRRGQAHWGLGDLNALRQEVETALAELNMPVPSSNMQLMTALTRAAARQVSHHLRPPRQETENPQRILELARSHILVGFAYFFLNEPLLTTYVALQQVNLAERLPPTPELAWGLATMALVSGLVPLHGAARRYHDRALTMAEQFDDRYALSQVLGTNSLYDLGVGDWPKVEALTERARAICQEIGDMRQWESVSGVLAILRSYRGDFAGAQALFRDVYDSARHNNNAQTQLWGTLGQAENLLFQGDLLGALGFLEDALHQPFQRFGRDSEVRALALAVMVYTRRRSDEAALAAAEKAYALVAQSPPSASYLSRHHAALAELYLTLWQEQPARRDYQQGAARMMKLLRSFTRVFPIAKPLLRLHEGWYAHLSGNTKRALQLWDAGVDDARRLQMPYEEGRLLAMLGAWTPTARRDTLLAEALAIFTRIGAQWEADRLRQ